MVLRRLGGVAALTLMLFGAQDAMAWGHQAHAAIDRAAIAALPASGPVFLREYADYIGASATVPDGWRNVSEPFAKIEEDPNHGWFRERFAFLKTIPRSRYEFILALYRENQKLERTDPGAARWTNVRWTGTLAYAVMEQYGHLVADMRALRATRAKATPRDAKFLEQTCAFDVVRLGHYVGDGSQPLHDSMNSDGWKGPNPKRYTTDGSIHARFESKYVKAIGLTDADVGQHIAALGHAHGDLFDAVLAFLNASGDQMETVYQLDQRGAFADPNDPAARALVYARTGAGASMLRDLLDRAWTESAQQPARNPVDPLDPKTAGYDRATGSAAAPEGSD